MDDFASPIAPSLPPTPRVSDSARVPIVVGILVVLVFFGIFGAWAAIAPLDGAVVGDGVVTVEGNRKSVQHLDGGIVQEIRVKEGDTVAAGDVIAVLDREKLSAQVDIYAQQRAVARAREARLVAELDGDDSVTFPPDMLTSDASYVKTAVAAQTKEFDARRVALQGDEQVLQHKINDLNEQIEGRRARATALEAQLASLNAEHVTQQGLLAKGLTTFDRGNDLDRQASSLQADIADNTAAIASAEENIEEDRQQSVQLTNDRRAQVASDLDDVRSKLLDLGPSLENAEASLQRTIVHSPYAGRVVGLKVFSVGAVIPPGGTLLDIVPERTKMIVEAHVNVTDISDVHIGSTAQVQFTSYQRLIIPTMRATVTNVSADRLTDERTGAAYYTAQVAVNDDDLRKYPDVVLYPGMPTQVMISTQKRSALEYLVGPLAGSFSSAFRQR